MVKKLAFRSARLAVLAAVLSVPFVAHANDVALVLGYEGTFTPPELISIEPMIVQTTDQLTGYGTHLGHFTGIYPHQVNFTDSTFTGTVTFTGENGDTLIMTLGGTGTPTSETTWSVSLTGTITGGTGQFYGATGSVAGTGTVDLAQLTTKAILVGTIDREDLTCGEDD